MKLVTIHQLVITILLVLKINSAWSQIMTLQACLDTAQVHNKKLMIAGNDITLGIQKQHEVKAYLIPKITANGEYKYFTDLPYQFMPTSAFNPAAPEGQHMKAQFGVPHNINGNVQLTMPLYHSQLIGAVETSKLATSLAELQYQRTEEEIFFDVSNLYYNVQILHHQLDFVEGNLVNANKLLKNIQLLHDQILAKGTDVSKVQLQLSQLNTQKETILGQYRQVLNALKFMMGLPIEADLKIDTEIQYHRSMNFSARATLDTRILSAKNRLLHSELNSLRRSQYLPSVNLFASYGSNGFGYGKKPNDFLKFYPVGFAGVQFSFPIFDGTITQRKIQQKKLEISNNDLRLQLASEQNAMEIENTVQQRKVAQANIETNAEQVALAQTIYDKIILQQKQGTATLTEVLLADNDLRQAQQSYLSSVVVFLKTDLELKKLMGNIRTDRN